MKKAISVLLCALLLLLPLTANAQHLAPLQFVVLGDSIAEGWNTTAPEYAYASLAAQELGFALTNLGAAGARTIDLLTELQNNGAMRAAVAAANVVEISIGGNDLLASSDPTGLATGIVFGNYAAVDQIFADAKVNLGNIVAEIRALNPDCVLVVQNIYDMGAKAINGRNPLYPLYTIPDSLMTTLTARGNQAVFVDYLAENPGAFLLADVFASFQWQTHASDIDWVHPNHAGHALIAKVLVDLLKTIELPKIAADDDHVYGEWETLFSATHTDDGLAQRVCECGKAETRTLPAQGHSFVWQTLRAASCSQDGEQLGVCACGYEEVQPIYSFISRIRQFFDAAFQLLIDYFRAIFAY